jgi:hypothetical protein
VISIALSVLAAGKKFTGTLRLKFWAFNAIIFKSINIQTDKITVLKDFIKQRFKLRARTRFLLRMKNSTLIIN